MAGLSRSVRTKCGFRCAGVAITEMCFHIAPYLCPIASMRDEYATVTPEPVTQTQTTIPS